MENFKGTKGKWEYKVISTKNQTKITVQIPETKYQSSKELIFGYLDREDDCNVASCCKTTEHANALLISKSPEMLEMIDELLKELSYHGFNNSTAIYKAKQLIKQATEI